MTTAEPVILPCCWCQRPTPGVTLAQYGARCFSCFQTYLAEPQPDVDCGDRRLDRLAWAKALKRRHEAGETLTPPQIEMYRHALGKSGTGAPDAVPADSARRLQAAKQAASARVEAYLREHPELRP